MGKVKFRHCTHCGSFSPELSDTIKVCEQCHKRVAEARARPYTETNIQKRARVDNEINKNFDFNYISKRREDKKHDDERRVVRQEKIKEERSLVTMAKFKDKLPDKPKYQLSTVINLRKYLQEAINDSGYIGSKLDSRKLARLATIVSYEADVPYRLVMELLSAYATTTLTQKAVARIVKRVAGNYLRLKEGLMVIDTNKDTPVEEWALLHILGSNSNFIDLQGRQGFNLVMDIYTGSLAGNVITSGYSVGVDRKFAKKLGVKSVDIKYFHPKMLSNMVGWGFLVPWSNGTTKPRSMDSTPTQVEKNRELMAGRIDISKCPNGYKPGTYVSCLDCPLGYDTKNYGLGSPPCPYAVRRDAIKVTE